MNHPPTPEVDPVAVVAEIKATVARRRAAGEYPAELLARLATQFGPVDVQPALEAQARLETARALESTRRGPASGAAIFAKRVVRRSIAWYVRPIAQDQTRFNFGVVRRLYALEARVAQLEATRARSQDPGAPPSEPSSGA